MVFLTIHIVACIQFQRTASVVSYDFYINRLMLIKNSIDLNSEKMIGLLAAKLQTEFGQFALSIMINMILKLFTIQTFASVDRGMIKLNRFHVELNSMLLTENWPSSICIFAVRRPNQFSEIRSIELTMNMRLLI